MKVIVGWVLVGLGLLFTFVWAAYAFVDAQLPELETRQDVEQLLLANLQTEHEGSPPPAGGSPLGPLPPDLVQLYLAQWDCPRFLAEPKQTGLSWKLGLLSHLFFGLRTGSGAGADCEQLFVVRLAEETGATTSFQKWVAALQLQSALTKEELIVFHLSVLYFDQGVVGVTDAARVLFNERLSDLALSQLAELMLALPPWGQYEDLRLCKNASLIQRARDQLLTKAVQAGGVPEDRARKASEAKVACRER